MNAEAAPPRTPYEALGGAPVISRIVNRFYDLMDSDAQYAELRAMHAPDLQPMRDSLAGWLSAWAGGPRDWHEQNPGKCMMSAHRGLGIQRDVANQWADAMARAIADCGPEDKDLAKAMAERIDMMAMGMVASD
ncbi:MAG: group II truncated hemoglobin [Sphingomonadaceae bacterium]|nr:group II truncated hemoglobin [Sphingomonadaceae bacterium]